MFYHNLGGTISAPRLNFHYWLPWWWAAEWNVLLEELRAVVLMHHSLHVLKGALTLSGSV